MIDDANFIEYFKRVDGLLRFSALLLLFIGGLFVTGKGAMLTLGWALIFGGPQIPFDPAEAAQQPDYAREKTGLRCQPGKVAKTGYRPVSQIKTHRTTHP
ncbi:MAG: hypothetical protein ACJAXW_002251 [Candidatus Azotimanducaceae bacterium]